jgi:aspartyl-tRNA(Asn)/glutamyl-tRNA(Gln) amidotransferase subunit A
MSSNSELARMDAVTIAREVRARRLSAMEVTDAALARMEALDPVIHAFCTPAPEVARVAAKRVDDEVRAGRDPGPLAGVPIGIKDLVSTAGIRTTSASWAYADFVPDEDDVVVERLRAAGAVILGKTNATEFGYSGTSDNPVFEATRNPWNPKLSPGGSSAGSAAAVAAGMCPFAVGSDGGGSVRIPASFCGLYAVKASMGRVPLYPGCKDERYPGVSSWESLEHIGPISRTVADSALMLSVISGPDDRDRYSLPAASFDWLEVLKGDLRGLRVAYSPDWGGYVTVDPRVREIAKRAAMVFEDLGCIVEEASPGWKDPGWAFEAIMYSETDLRGMRALADKLGDRMSPHLSAGLRRAWTAEEFTDAMIERKAVCNKMWRFMRRYDLLLTPTLAALPFEVGPLGKLGPDVIDGKPVGETHWLAFTYPMNFTGQPAASVPAGWTDDGLPVGLQIVGRHLDDPLVLRASAAYEAAAPWKDRWPQVSFDAGKGAERHGS